ncbi:MAG: hypothetical protein R3F61_13080 [Myxococcota bacterium]
MKLERGLALCAPLLLGGCSSAEVRYQAWDFDRECFTREVEMRPVRYGYQPPDSECIDVIWEGTRADGTCIRILSCLSDYPTDDPWIGKQGDPWACDGTDFLFGDVCPP